MGRLNGEAVGRNYRRLLENVPYVPGFPPGFSYDFNVYSAKKIREKLEYMHANPVKRGLVKNPSD